MREVDPELEDDAESLWAEHVVRLGAALPSAQGAARRNTLGGIWKVLNLALQKYVRQHGAKLGRLSPQAVREIAADKASDLILRLDKDDWNLSALTAEGLRAFLATVARNGVVDFLRSAHREVTTGQVSETVDARRGMEEQENAVAREEIADALAECASKLTPRSRRAWLLRVFYDWSAADIARHPAVASSPAGVDQMLARCREQIQECMESKGIPLRGLPVGTFVRLWELTERERSKL